MTIRGEIKAKRLNVGRGVVVEEGTVISGPFGEEADEVTLGDYCFLGGGTKIMVPEFRIGDYTKLHGNCFVRGEKPLQIGRNCWIGGNTILDSLGGLDIDDNVGIGAHSQLWTHIQFGDIVEGCRFYSNRHMYIGKDAWFVGHCIVSPVDVGERSMAMAGSVITKDMLPNHIYGGSPAKDLTDKLGTQFEARSIDQKEAAFSVVLAKFEAAHPEYQGAIRVVRSYDGVVSDSTHTHFNLTDRTYTKTHNAAEVAFLKSNVPLIKFTPHNEGSFIVRKV
jgi:acetyltransferase-like isoleucine patch superfamily enzyme